MAVCRTSCFMLAAFRPAIVVLIVVALAACGHGEQAVPVSSPVLVAHPNGGGEGAAMDGLTAYAGEVRAREETALSFRVGGTMARRVVDVGDRVRAGDLLAELDSNDAQLRVQALKAELAVADAQLVRARADHARTASLIKEQLVSRTAFDQQTAALRAAEEQARAARAQVDLSRNQAGYSRLVAPRDGAIASRLVEAGQVLTTGQTVFTFAADGAREVVFALPETSIARFNIGQPVIIELWSDAGSRISGHIREIAPVADPQTRTYAARATLDASAAQRINLGQSARVYIPAAQDAAAMRLPLSALQRGANDATTVWVVDPTTPKTRRVPVKIGPFTADGVAVLSGLKPSDWVVMAGGHLLHEGQSVLPVDRSNRPIKPN